MAWESSEMAWEKPRRAQKWSGGAERGTKKAPKWPENSKEAQKWFGTSPERLKRVGSGRSTVRFTMDKKWYLPETRNPKALQP